MNFGDQWKKEILENLIFAIIGAWDSIFILRLELESIVLESKMEWQVRHV